MSNLLKGKQKENKWVKLEIKTTLVQFKIWRKSSCFFAHFLFPKLKG